MLKEQNPEYWNSTYPDKRYRVERSNKPTLPEQAVILDTVSDRPKFTIQGPECREAAEFLCQELNKDNSVLDSITYDHKPSGVLVKEWVANIKTALVVMRKEETEVEAIIASSSDRHYLRVMHQRLVIIKTDISKAELCLADLYPIDEMGRFAQHCKEVYSL